MNMERDITLRVNLSDDVTKISADNLGVTIRDCDGFVYIEADCLAELIEALKAVQKEFGND